MRIVHLALNTAFCLLAAAAVSFAGTSVHFELNVKKAAADSLQDKADSLEEAASRLEDKLDDIEDVRSDRDDVEDEIDDLKERIEDLKDQIKEANEDINDARTDLNDDVEETRKEAIADISESRKEALDDIDEANSRRKNGSFILGFEYSRLDTDPFKSLLKNDRSLQNARGHFDFTQNHMMMFGLMGYYSLENNVRVGNGIYAGYRSFTSSTIRDTLLTGRIDSSLVSLNIIPAYIGFICEKAFVYEPVNFFAGIMLGGNMTTVVKKEQPAALASSFLGSEEHVDGDEISYSVALAPALAWDVHGGIAVGLSPNLHLGVDGVLRFAYAYEGFGAGFGDFLSVSPGVRLRLTFGSAG